MGEALEARDEKAVDDEEWDGVTALHRRCQTR